MSEHCTLSPTESGDCHTDKSHHGGCHGHSDKPDYLLWGSLLIITVLYVHHGFFEHSTHFARWYQILATSVYDLINTVWWGILSGMLMVALLIRVPREFVMSILGTGRGNGLQGILRATLAGVLLDLCNHGILMIAAKLYERGASIGQVMAFLIASPWNSFSLTLILIALVGIPWTIGFIMLSMLIAVTVGLLYERLTESGVLPPNPHQIDLPTDFDFWHSARAGLRNTQFDSEFFRHLLIDGLTESRMVLRWIFFGVILAGLVRALVSPEQFGTYFGPTLGGLGLTVLAATLIEVCSEGSTPIAADLLTRANAPGNSFAFLMSGVATDYTEIMVVRETTHSWRIALFLPLLAVPQIIVIAWLINTLMT